MFDFMKKRTYTLVVASLIVMFGTAASAGRTYYVDPSGNDGADGLSPATAWRSPARAFQTAFGPGDRLLFRAGCHWRIEGTLQAKAKGTETEPVLISRYGEGPQPEFRGSLDATQPGFWTAAGDGLWRANVSGKTDVGNIVCVAKGTDAATCGWKHWKLADLQNEGDYFHDLAAGVVWYRSRVDPATIYERMELCRRISLLSVGQTSWLRVEGISFLYTGAHGIVGAPVQHLRVRDCTFGWIGGSLLAMWPDGRGGTYPVRYGNGIEFWAKGHSLDIRLENNYFYEVYDTAMTNQGDCGGILEQMVIASNRTERCEQSYEVWFTSTNYLVKSIELFGNRFEDAGYGWSHAQRPNKNATHLLAYGFDCKVGSISYHNNYFGRTKQCMFWWFSSPTIRHIRLDHNVYEQPGIDAETWHGLFRWRGERSECLPTWSDYRRLTGDDAHSTLRTPPEADPVERARLEGEKRNWIALGNGDFEVPSAHSSGAFVGWSVTDPRPGSKCRAVADDVVKHGGNYALRLDAAKGERFQVARNVDLRDRVFRPGSRYRVRAALRHASGPRNWAFNFGVYTDKLACLHGRNFTASGDDWTLVSDEFELPKGGSIIRFMFNAADGASYWADDLHLEERLDNGTWRDVIWVGH